MFINISKLHFVVICNKTGKMYSLLALGSFANRIGRNKIRISSRLTDNYNVEHGYMLIKLLKVNIEKKKIKKKVLLR